MSGNFTKSPSIVHWLRQMNGGGEVEGSNPTSPQLSVWLVFNGVYFGGAF